MPKLLIMYSNGAPTDEHVGRLERLGPGVRVAVARDESGAMREAADAEVFLGHRYLAQCLPHARRLKWLLSTAAGVDHVLTPALRSVAPIVTRAPIFSDAIAFHALTIALSVSRRIPQAVATQGQRRWASQDEFDVLPIPRVAMVIGLGYIGRTVAGLLRGMGMKVIGVDRLPDPRTLECCDEFRPTDRWRDSLDQVDLCFMAIPGSPENRHFVNDAALSALPKHAVLVNIGRGMTVDHAALLRRLRAGLLGGAALDVLDEVPDELKQQLWTEPRVLITPKLCSFVPDRQPRLEAHVESQVKRYLAGEALEHLVNLITPTAA